jgi:CheY-like chemotaxis protein
MSHKLLLADDSATIQRVIELTFSGEDVHVLAVGDGEQAIARIPVEHPDIVLADIGMPKRSGYDVAAFVKGSPDLKHIPVLLLAGAFEPVDEARAEQVGCDGVLVKPFEPQHVIARVRELLEGAIGSPTQATPAVARPAERLAAARTIEFPRREEPPPRPVPTMERDTVDEFDFGSAAALQPLPEPPTPAGPDESLDDYFDRLDAAFAVLDTTPPGPGSDAATALDGRTDLPTLDEILGVDFTAPPAPVIDLPLHSPPIASSPVPPPVEPPDITPTRAPQTAETGAPPARNIVADAFSALLVVEQGEPGATPVRLTTASEPPAITDALVEELTRRVIQRLAPNVVRDLVAQVVSEVTERLVRDEIQRIRSRQ